jgi:hypothetical protein
MSFQWLAVAQLASARQLMADDRPPRASQKLLYSLCLLIDLNKPNLISRRPRRIGATCILAGLAITRISSSIPF